MKNLIEKFEIHDYLNPALWNSNNQLLPEVKQTILNIVNRYKNDIEIPLDIRDIWIVGSNASYNYTDDSDIDVHLIVNTDNIDVNDDIFKILLNLYTKKFKNDYPNLRIRGFEVELYIQDMNSSLHSNGIYSVTKGTWVVVPKKLSDVKPVDVSDEVNKLASQTERLLLSNNIAEVVKQLDKIYMIRKIGIMKEGEFGKGNLIFKELRNLGYIDKLKDRIKELKEKALILEQKNS